MAHSGFFLGGGSWSHHVSLLQLILCSFALIPLLGLHEQLKGWLVVRQGKGTVIERLGVPPLLLVEERRRKKSEVEVRGIVGNGILARLGYGRGQSAQSASNQSAEWIVRKSVRSFDRCGLRIKEK